LTNLAFCKTRFFLLDCNNKALAMKFATCLSALLLYSHTLVAQNSTLDVEQYSLANGLTVYLNHDPTASQVYGAVVVKAGSKNDPEDATGMAHYLEHLLFKGTTELGTTNYEEEKPYLDSINICYDLLSKTADEAERKRLQNLINEQSILASKYGLPTEFDKLIKNIGGTGLNAFTTSDMTVYHNSFPEEQMDKWLELYSHRFDNPVFRSFQSELEVVYEEKNRSMDGFVNLLIELMNKNLFKDHPYGTQTAIGSVEHLKNPSLNKIYSYFDSYYVPNNMALVLCGNFKTALAKPMIEHHFSKLKSGDVPAFPDRPKTVFDKNEIVKVKYTPIKFELIGYKTIPTVHEDMAALEVAINLLFNESETGAFNKLERDHKLMAAAGFNYTFNDDGALMFLLVPKLIGQSFEKAEKLFFTEIDRLREGDILDDAIRIVKTGLYRQHQQSLENYRSRTINIATIFSNNTSWEKYLNYGKELDAITKEDIVQVSQKYFGAHHFTLRSRRGNPKKTVLEKPGYKPVVTDQNGASVFATAFDEHQLPTATPKFIDVDNDASRILLNESNILYSVVNPINDVFSLKVGFRVGSDSLKHLDLASDLSSYFHTTRLNLDQMKEEFAKLGLSYYTYCGKSTFQINFTGLENHLEASIELINQLIYDPVVDQKVMKIIRDAKKANRKFEVKDPATVGDALKQFAVFGPRSYYIDRIGLKDLKKLESDDLVDIFKKASRYNAVWHFVGKTSGDSVGRMINSHLVLANNRIETPPTTWDRAQTEANLIYITNDKKAVQSQVNFYIPSVKHTYTALSKTQIAAFNEYIGGGFSGLILQEVREFRSLAYSAYGRLSASYRIDQTSFFTSFIGCQADKTNEAISVMVNLLDSMPLKPDRIETIKNGLKNSASIKYPGFRYISRYLENSEIYGDVYLFSPQEYEYYDSLQFSDVEEVYNTFIEDRPMIISISGNKSKIDEADLAKIGQIIHIKKKKLFTR
jgi:predicted Zn-dependent peptidase